MGWSTTSDLDQFAAAAGGYLTTRTAENSLLLSAAQPSRAQACGAGVLYGWWTPADGGGPRGAFVHDQAAPLLISGRVPELATALAVTLAKPGRPDRRVTGVDAPTEAADAFAAAWSQRAGTVVQAHRASRVYRLTAQDPAIHHGATRHGAAHGSAVPDHGWPPPELPAPLGRLRVAAPDECELVARWLSGAAAEAGERLAAPGDLAEDLIGYGGAVFWEVPRGSGRLREAARALGLPHHRDQTPVGEPALQPVALAALTRPAAGSVRIDRLYTLPERRGSGYGAALTQAVSRALLWGGGPDGGQGDGRGGAPPGLLGGGQVREVVMIMDKNRPNQWSTRFGYQLVGERSVLRFGPPTGPMPRAHPTRQPRLPTGPLPRLPRLRG